MTNTRKYGNIFLIIKLSEGLKMEKKEIINSFLDELKTNKELAEKFLAQKDSVDGAYNVAKPYLSGMSKDEFSREMEKLAQKILESGELSPEALEAVSGGMSDLAMAGTAIGIIAVAGVAMGGLLIAAEVHQLNRQAEQTQNTIKAVGKGGKAVGKEFKKAGKLIGL